MQLRLNAMQRLRRHCANQQHNPVTYRRNVSRIFRRAAPHGVSAPMIGIHYMPFTHSVERWHA